VGQSRKLDFSSGSAFHRLKTVLKRAPVEFREINFVYHNFLEKANLKNNSGENMERADFIMNGNYATRRLNLLLLLGFFICFLTFGFLFYGFGEISVSILQSGSSELPGNGKEINQFQSAILFYGIPGLFVLFTSIFLFLRWRIGRLFKTPLNIEDRSSAKKERKEKQVSVEDPEKIIYRVDKNREKLLYSHLLTVFQRKGRWVDFLFENLKDYEDAQIGAAVRSIHENCRKALDEHLSVQPILEGEDGAEIILEEGFSREAIRLTGQVIGTPPFKGVIRHRGWRIHRMDLPEFSSGSAQDILSPGEVEIL